MRSFILTRKAASLGAIAAGAAALMIGPVQAASANPSGSSGYSLFGDATLVHPGYNSATAAQASYDGASSSGGVDFAVPAGMTLNQLSNLSTEYQFTSGSCKDGAPRFGAQVTNGTNSGYIFFYIGPPPGYTLCPDDVWANTGNLASAANPVDDSQLPGGAFYDPYASAQSKYGSYTVTDLFVVEDGFDGTPTTVQFDNTMVNQTTYTYENSDSCKDGGWQQFTSSPGPFKNQGDCVSYYATGGKNS